MEGEGRGFCYWTKTIMSPARGLLLACLLCLHAQSGSAGRETNGERALANAGGRLVPYYGRTEPEQLCRLMKCRKPAGSVCHVVTTENGTRIPKCMCPKTCPGEQKPVCSAYGRQYDNACLLYKEACRRRRRIGISYYGECIARQGACSDAEGGQFPFRLLEWFLHLKEIDAFGTVDPSSSQASLDRQQRTLLAAWKFAALDREGDGELSRRDIKDLRFRLMPLEHCAEQFFRSCDKNDNKMISEEEWTSCLVERSESWYETFMSKKMGPGGEWIES